MKKIVILLSCLMQFTSLQAQTKLDSTKLSVEKQSKLKTWHVTICVNAVFVEACVTLECFWCSCPPRGRLSCTVQRVAVPNLPAISTVKDLVEYIENHEGIPPGTLNEIEISSSESFYYETGEGPFQIEAKKYSIDKSIPSYSVPIEIIHADEAIQTKGISIKSSKLLTLPKTK